MREFILASIVSTGLVTFLAVVGAASADPIDNFRHRSMVRARASPAA